MGVPASCVGMRGGGVGWARSGRGMPSSLPRYQIARYRVRADAVARLGSSLQPCLLCFLCFLCLASQPHLDSHIPMLCFCLCVVLAAQLAFCQCIGPSAAQSSPYCLLSVDMMEITASSKPHCADARPGLAIIFSSFLPLFSRLCSSFCVGLSSFPSSSLPSSLPPPHRIPSAKALKDTWRQ